MLQASYGFPKGVFVLGVGPSPRRNVYGRAGGFQEFIGVRCQAKSSKARMRGCSKAGKPENLKYPMINRF